ncbi:MAG: formylglycine-generating enzyme family protein [bacterium]|nr:formylglycine-generating enzyme family protein [bacterium]
MFIYLGNSCVMEMVKVPGGFVSETKYLCSVETKAESYLIGKYPVTQLQYGVVTGEFPSYRRGDNLPVENLSPEDCVEFTQRMSIKGLRLPTLTEWFYACRANLAAGADKLFEDTAWYVENSSKTTHEVGQLKGNPWNLYDMLGNVWEICTTFTDDKNIQAMVKCGGSYNSDKRYLQPYMNPINYVIGNLFVDFRTRPNTGFRVVLSPREQNVHEQIICDG